MLTKIATVLAILVVLTGAGRFILAADDRSRDNQEVIDELKLTQQEIVDWMQLEKEQQIRREVIRKLCEEGKLAPEDCD